MLSYELAKLLKDGGFPQKGEGWIVFENGNQPMQGQLIGVPDVVAYSPTLSELIEACGDKLEKLEKAKMFDEKLNRLQPWSASTQETKGFYKNTSFGGKTPEEAVAALWLSLNKNPV